MELSQANNSTNTHKVGDYIGTVNTQGRVTLHEEVRKALQVHPQDKVIFRLAEGRVEIIGKLPTLEELAGSLTSLQPGQDLEEVIREAKAEHYERRFTQKMQP
jgi:bifunctional DNA-binding transcriptional regulator/antitoxin component of YhaV-PrlF toxin-antitoxin module